MLEQEARSRTHELVCLIASFVADDPAAAGATDTEIVTALRERWPDLRPPEIQAAFDVAAALKGARASQRRNELQILVERVRLYHGARAAADLVYRYSCQR